MSEGASSFITEEAALRKLRDSSLGRQHSTVPRAVPWYIIMPNTKYSYAWEIVMLLPLVWVITLLPIAVCFIEEEGAEPWMTIDLIVTGVFAVDMVVNFFSAYVEPDTRVLVTSHSKIAKNYLKLWFWLDLMATLPMGLVQRTSSGSNQLMKLSRLPRVFRLFRLMRLLRLARMARLAEYTRKIEVYFNLTASFARFFRTIFWAIIVTHLSASLWHFIAMQQGFEDSWIGEAQLQHTSVYTRYVASCHWAFATLSSVGYGDIHAVTETEMLFGLVLMFLGLIWSGFMVGNIMSLLSSIDREVARTKNRKTEVESMIRASPHMDPKLKAKLQDWADLPVGRPQRSTLLLDMPASLRHQTVYTHWYPTISQNPMLMAVSPTLASCEPVAEFCYKATQTEFEQASTLFEAGTPCRYCFLIVRGEVALFQGQHLKAIYDAGDVCGLAEAMFSFTHVTCARALSDVTALALTRQGLHTVSQGYPELRAKLEEVARSTVKALDLGIDMPLSVTEQRRAATKIRTKVLQSAVRGGLWRKFTRQMSTKPSKKRSRRDMLKKLTEFGLSPVIHTDDGESKSPSAQSQSPSAIDAVAKLQSRRRTLAPHTDGHSSSSASPTPSNRSSASTARDSSGNTTDDSGAAVVSRMGAASASQAATAQAEPSQDEAGGQSQDEVGGQSQDETGGPSQDEAGEQSQDEAGGPSQGEAGGPSQHETGGPSRGGAGGPAPSSALDRARTEATRVASRGTRFTTPASSTSVSASTASSPAAQPAARPPAPPARQEEGSTPAPPSELHGQVDVAPIVEEQASGPRVSHGGSSGAGVGAAPLLRATQTLPASSTRWVDTSAGSQPLWRSKSASVMTTPQERRRTLEAVAALDRKEEVHVDKFKDVLLTILAGQRALARSVHTNHKNFTDSAALMAEQVDMLSNKIEELKWQMDAMQEAVG